MALVFPVTSTNESTLSVISTVEQASSTSGAFLDSLNQSSLDQRALSPYGAIAMMPHTLMEYEYASGNWFGRRDALHSYGIDPSVTYTADIVGNPVGGTHPKGSAYADEIVFACLFKTEKLFGWRNGYFMISAFQRDGASLSQDNIGNEFLVQRVYSGETIHWQELSYEQKFWDEHVGLKVGRTAANEDFSTSPLYLYYMNKGIDSYPRALAVNGDYSTSRRTFWGSRLKADLTSSTVARLGVYQVTTPSVNGLNWNFYPSDGVMILGQYEWNPEFFKPSTPSINTDKTSLKSASVQAESSSASSDIPARELTLKGFNGHYWMGGYYSTWEYQQFNSSIQAPNSYALYWHADQLVYRPDPLRDKGLVLWSVFVLSPQENISLIPLQINSGAIYTGLIPGRPDDATIFGVVYGTFSTSDAGVQEEKKKGDSTYELVYEAGYRINLTKFTYIQPDLQWIINPGGTGRIPNALVIGAQVGVVF